MFIERPDSHPDLEDDQQEVFDTYHDSEAGRVCVDAGAGTGKTTTLIETVAEAILRELKKDNENPMDDILVTTFTVDAAAELKSKLKKRLREHEEAADVELDPDIWYQIETESHIQTIDSFIQDLLAEVSAELGLPTEYEIRDDLDSEDLYDEIMEKLRSEEQYAEMLNRLEEAYPAQEWQDYPPDTVRDLLVRAHEKRREFCWSVDQLQEHLEASVQQQMYTGRSPPFDDTDIITIGRELTGETGTVSDKLIDHVTEVYNHNLQLVRDFGQLAQQFNKEYERAILEGAGLTHTDVTYYVWEAVEHGSVNNWVASLRDRFDHIFVDEFQDTNYAQCRILSQFIRNEDPQNGVLLIGDVKQSIYQWRSAEPRIFAEIIEIAQKGSTDEVDEYLEAEGLVYQPLRSNFRSHPHLVSAANHFFEDIFADPGRGDIGFDVPYTSLNPQRLPTEQEDSHLHLLRINEDNSNEHEAERIAQTISGLLDNKQTKVVDTENSNPIEDPELRDPVPGDIALLFRRRTYMETYARRLREYGIATAIDVTAGLFAEPEVQLLINVFDWFAHPHSKDSLVRILRSPITAVSDETLRYLASKNFFLSRALEEWPSELSDSDRDRLEGLIQLRNDLRWDREGSKAKLIERTIRHTALDTIVLTDLQGKQRYGNIWQLIEVVTDWEEEELLSYQEFLVRIKRLRGRALQGDENHPVAQIADEDSDEVVRLTTVHGSKGLEYPIVFLPDLDVEAVWFPYEERMYQSRQHGIALHPQTGDQSPVDYDPGGGGAWIKDTGSGTIWVSDKKSSDGSLEYDNELTRHIRDDIAEHWRVLYVAFTRASDHLFLGLHDSASGIENWMNALHSCFAPDDNDIAHHDVTTKYSTENGRITDSIPVEVDDISPGTRTDPDPIGIDKANQTIQYSDDDFGELTLDFVPQSLNPSSLHALLTCPLRFQYESLQRVSKLRADIPPESNPPAQLRPNAWGTIVHQALERFHNSTMELDRFLQSHPETVRRRLEEVIDDYQLTDTYSEVETADKVLSEHELESVFRNRSTELYISGQVDLLYQTSEGWHIVDFKTGKRPEEGAYLYENYRYQIMTYTWLLQDMYNIAPSSARLVFLTPSTEEIELDTELSGFVREIENIPSNLEVINKHGLKSKPVPDPGDTDDPSVYTRCGSCAYRILCPEWSEES